MKKPNFKFEVLYDSDKAEMEGLNLLLMSNIRSECCTRTCTRYATPATPEQWNRFLEIDASKTVQY